MMACNLVGPAFLAYEAELRAFLLKRLKDPDAVHDILNEILLKVHANCAKLPALQNTRAWLYTITRNALTDYWRENQRFQLQELPEKLATTEGEDINPQLAGLIPRFLEFLPEKYRIPLQLSDLEDIPQQQIADHLGISLSGAKSRIQRGRKLLREKFSECLQLELDHKGIPIDFSVKPHCQEALVREDEDMSACCPEDKCTVARD